eukprot:s1076_g5.t1
MAQRLQDKLKSRSGLFQYADLSQIEPDESRPEVPENQSPTNASQNSLQPEEEPVRRTSIDLQGVAEQFATAQSTPVPESPMSAAHDEPAEDRDMQSESAAPSTASLETDDDEAVVDMQPVYNVTLIENGSHSDIVLEDNETVWSPKDGYEQACTSFAFEMPQQQWSRFLARPEEHFANVVTAAKKSRELFAKAKQKELQCWLDTDTVRAIVRDRIHPSRIMSSRWILTWKEDNSIPGGRKAKARLVVKGFQDPDISTLNSDSPTMTRDARMLLLQTVSSSKWTVQSFDITTAFLRGRSDDRELAMEAPPELKAMMGMNQNHVCLLKGNAYGRVDAPLLFYREFRKRLENVGFVAHPLDSCLFLMRNAQDPEKLDGILGTHVDDGIGGGNENFEIALEKLQKTLPFGTREYGKFKFTGLDIEQLPDYSIKVNQGSYVHKIQPIHVPKIRRAYPDSSITSQEMQQLRGLCGSLQYAAVHSRPDLATKVAGLQKGINQATVETLLEGNRVLREAQAHADTSVIVRPIPIADLSFASFGDASFASAKQLSAQQGLMTGPSTTPACPRNRCGDTSANGSGVEGNVFGSRGCGGQAPALQQCRCSPKGSRVPSFTAPAVAARGAWHARAACSRGAQQIRRAMSEGSGIFSKSNEQRFEQPTKTRSGPCVVKDADHVQSSMRSCAQRLFYLVEFLPVHCYYLWTRELNVQCTGFDDPSMPGELEVQGCIGLRYLVEIAM